MNSLSQLLQQLAIESAWMDGNDSIVRCNTIALHRNIARYAFPKNAHPYVLDQIISLLRQFFSKNHSRFLFQVMDTKKLSPYEKQFICEHYLLP